MSDPILASAESLLARARATSAKTHGTPLRSATMETEHRELIQALEQMLDYHNGFARVHRQLVRLVSRVRSKLIEGSNGTRFWNRSLPPEAKTALTLLNNYLRLSS